MTERWIEDIIGEVAEREAYMEDENNEVKDFGVESIDDFCARFFAEN